MPTKDEAEPRAVCDSSFSILHSAFSDKGVLVPDAPYSHGVVGSPSRDPDAGRAADYPVRWRAAPRHEIHRALAGPACRNEIGIMAVLLSGDEDDVNQAIAVPPLQRGDGRADREERGGWDKRRKRDPAANPFPGMNPFLEDPVFWSDFHATFIVCWRDEIRAVLPKEQLRASSVEGFILDFRIRRHQPRQDWAGRGGQPTDRRRRCNFVIKQPRGRDGASDASPADHERNA